MLNFYDLSYVRSRCDRTFLKVKGETALIRSIRFEDSNYVFSYLTGSNLFTETLVPDDITFNDLTIGAFYFKQSIVWGARLPVRRWKAGLNRDNFSYRQPGSFYPNILTPLEFDAHLLSIFDMLNKKYSSVDDVLKYGRGIFSQKWFVENNKLYRKSSFVGIVNKSFILFPEFKHYQEELDRVATS